MTQLSKEYFDQKLGGLATKIDLEQLARSTEQQVGKLASATKQQMEKLASKAHLERVELSLDRKLQEQTALLKDYTGAQISELRTEVREGFASMDEKLDALRELLDVRQRVEHLEEQVRQLQAQK